MIAFNRPGPANAQTLQSEPPLLPATEASQLNSGNSPKLNSWEIARIRAPHPVVGGNLPSVAIICYWRATGESGGTTRPAHTLPASSRVLNSFSIAASGDLSNNGEPRSIAARTRIGKNYLRLFAEK